jgi:multimeric flavodoxin WrbA
MQIVVLHGQSHHGSTWHITRQLIDQLNGQLNEDSHSVTEFQTNAIPPCTGCFSCIMSDEALCPHRAVVGPMIEAIEQAEVVIVESPNYCMGMSGQLKIFFDHMAYRWMSHRPHPSMKHKIGIAISTTAGVGAQGTAKAITQQMFWWGISKTYHLAFAVSASSWGEVKADKKVKITGKVKRCVRRINQAVGRTKPGIRSRFIFGIMKAQQKGNIWNHADRKHWEDNGWI